MLAIEIYTSAIEQKEFKRANSIFSIMDNEYKKVALEILAVYFKTERN